MKLIVLDRDGVINEDSPNFIKSPEEWLPIPGSIEAIAKFNLAGYRVVVATNQSGIARGYFTQAILDAIHKKMNDLVVAAGGRIEGIYICPHGPQDNCLCRKPKPGLLLQIAKEYNLQPADMLVIGDSMRDILAAQACGALAFLVKTGKGEETIGNVKLDVPVYQNLAAAAEAICISA